MVAIIVGVAGSRMSVFSYNTVRVWSGSFYQQAGAWRSRRSVRNKELEFVNSTVFLGITLDDRLQWSPHISYKLQVQGILRSRHALPGPRSALQEAVVENDVSLQTVGGNVIGDYELWEKCVSAPSRRRPSAPPCPRRAVTARASDTGRAVMTGIYPGRAAPSQIRRSEPSVSVGRRPPARRRRPPRAAISCVSDVSTLN
ncbi:hypothetical protein EVAR_51956_1 [Eumeta japonica]|uniref:Uncharacterized protein n=1 Tax=Eumeta variegata TaxID=151549 RepID=A0A4C1Y370_EUMVA|nr:hypothetical protein EVAR_51956_1 [Eumeta japonica]